MDRYLWLQSFITSHSCPPWHCAICGKSTLSLIPKSVIKHETAESQEARKHDEWDPDWVTYGFTAWAQCQNAACKQHYAISGTGSVSPEQDEDGDLVWEDFFDPKHTFPVLRPIKIPEKCPDVVSVELDAAFALYWRHPAASAARLRVALELLLNHQGIPKRKREANGKYRDLRLHARLVAFAQANPTSGAQLMALKFLGNSGSHESSVSKEDLIDAFEVLEHVLGEIIEQRSKRVAALSKKLIKKHG